LYKLGLVIFLINFLLYWRLIIWSLWYNCYFPNSSLLRSYYLCVLNNHPKLFIYRFIYQARNRSMVVNRIISYTRNRSPVLCSNHYPCSIVVNRHCFRHSLGYNPRCYSHFYLFHLGNDACLSSSISLVIDGID